MTPATAGSRADIALLLLRLVVGAAFVLHGLPKLEHPLTWAAGMLPHLPGWLQALAACVELGGGIALIAGIVTPLFAALIAGDMAVAILFVLVPHGATFVGGSANKPTYELELTFLASAVALVLLGPGRYSVDAIRARGGSARRRRR